MNDYFNNIKCTKCKIDKPPDLFYKNKLSKNGLTHACKACIKDAKKIYNKTRKGNITEMYHNSVNSANYTNRKGPNFSKKDFIFYCSESEVYNNLYLSWRKSGYDKMLRPAFARVNMFGNYEFGNMCFIVVKKFRQKLSEYKIEVKKIEHWM